MTNSDISIILLYLCMVLISFELYRIREKKGVFVSRFFWTILSSILVFFDWIRDSIDVIVSIPIAIFFLVSTWTIHVVGEDFFGNNA